MGRVSDDIKKWSSTAKIEDKVRMLRTLAETLGELERNGETLNEKEWERRYREAQDTARTESKSKVHILETLMKSRTALAAAERRALAASLRPKTGGGSGNSKGETLWQDWIKKHEPGSDQNMADPGSRMNPTKALDTMIADLRSADFLRAEDKARPYLTQRVLDSGIITPEKLREAIGEEMWQAYLDGKDTDAGSGARAAAAADRLEAGTFTAPDLDALKDEALRHANVDEKDVPRKERERSDLEQTLAAQMEGLDLTEGGDRETGLGRWTGLTDDEVGDLVSRPGFQRWAKAHDLVDIGRIGEDGRLVIGKDTAKAVRMAVSQTRKNPPIQDAGEFVGEVLHGPSEPKYIRGPVVDGKITSVWVPRDDGSVDLLDLTTGRLTAARNRQGFWASGNLRDTFAKSQADDPEPHPYGVKGQPAWTYDEIKAHGPIDVTAETNVSSDPAELLETPPPVVKIAGRVRKPLFGEDPLYHATVTQGDGSLLRLERDTPESPWRRVDDELNAQVFVTPETIEIGKTKVVGPKREKEMRIAAFRKARGVKDEPEVTDEEIAAFNFPGHAPGGDEEAAAALTFKGPGTVDTSMTPEDRAKIMHKVDADLLGEQLQEGGERMVKEAKRDKAIMADVREMASKAAARPRPTIPAPVVALPEETDVPEVNMGAVKAAEAEFEKRLAAKTVHDLGDETVVVKAPKKEVHDLGETDIVVRPPSATEMVNGQPVPVRIKPKTDAELRADALRRARELTTGA